MPGPLATLRPDRLGFLLGAWFLLAATSPSQVDVPTVPSGEEGFISLFNGRDLTGWTPKIKGEAVGADRSRTFRVRDGCVVVDYEAYSAFEGRFGHLFHEQQFGDYVLRLEYRFTGEQCAGGPGWALRNSGVMIHGQTPDTMGLDQEFPVSIEVQFLGGDGTHPRTTANLCTPGTNVEMDGALITRHCTDSVSSTYHGPRWVAVEIEVRGDQIVRHRVEGETVLEYRAPQLDPRDADARRLIDSRAGALRLTSGTISLQSESHPVAFRNIRLRRLEPRR